MPNAGANKCATLRHGGRYGNSASLAAAAKFGSLKGAPQGVVGIKNPQPPTVSTVSKEFGAFGSATLDRRTTSTFGGGGGLNNIDENRRSDQQQLQQQQQKPFTIEGSSTFGRPMGNNNNINSNKSLLEASQVGGGGVGGMGVGLSGNATSSAAVPKTISILNQPLPEIPQSALKIDAPLPPIPTNNSTTVHHQQPLSAANLSHYQMSNGPKSSFSMTSQLLQSGNQSNSMNTNSLGGGAGGGGGNNSNYPLKSSMKQQQQQQYQQPPPPLSSQVSGVASGRPSIQQAPLPPPPIQQPKPQMFSSINSTRTLPPQLPPKNRHKEPTMPTGQNQPHMSHPQHRQTLPNSKSQSTMTQQFNKSNPQYATFMGYSENNNNKVVDSGDKARLIQQYYQETSNMRNNNNHHQQQQQGDYGTNMKMPGQIAATNKMPQYSYQTLPHQPAKFSQQQQHAIMLQQQQQQQQQYGQFAGGVQQQHHPQHQNYMSGKIPSGHSSVGTQIRHGGGGASGGTGKVDRNSNIEQMTYYRSLQRGATAGMGRHGEAGSANNDLYSDNLMYRHRK